MEMRVQNKPTTVLPEDKMVKERSGYALYSVGEENNALASQTVTASMSTALSEADQVVRAVNINDESNVGDVDTELKWRAGHNDARLTLVLS